MPRRVVGYTELGGGKLKKGKGILKPNFGVWPNLLTTNLVVHLHYRDLRVSAFDEWSRAVA